jgi:hypothetical protein
MSQISIDGKWHFSKPTDDFGKLGLREICDLGATPGQPHKKLLLRRITWPQEGMPPGSPPLPLAIHRVADGHQLGLREALDKTYYEITSQPSGSSQPQPCRVYQQDITDLIPLRQAIFKILREGKVERFWLIFDKACWALEQLGNTAQAAGRPVLLQLPESLAVGRGNRVVPLDAEIGMAAPMPATGEARKLYQAWFGNQCRNGMASPEEASVLHGKALRAFMRQLLGLAFNNASPEVQPGIAKIIQRIDQLSPGTSLEDFDGWIRQNAVDWGITIEDSPEPPPQNVAPMLPQPQILPTVSHPARKKRPWLLRTSLWLNLAFILAIIIMALLWPRGSEAKPKGDSPENKVPEEDDQPADKPKQRPILVGPTLFFSSYCVVFPTQGTISEKVYDALQKMFPGKVKEIRQSARRRGRLLRDKMAEAIKSLKEPKKLKLLILQLADKKMIRFKGFSASEPEESLVYIIESGGIFSYLSQPGERHGSLLQPNGLDKILKQAKLKGRKGPRQLLGNLKEAIFEYATLKDALSIIGDRVAFLIRVSPTAQAHEQMRKKLLQRVEKPVFVSRPVLELFDAVDPTADTGGGSAAYSLRLDRNCYWRQASLEDRRNVNFAKNPSNDRMKWQFFGARKRIIWKPIPVMKKNGRTTPISSFDIAVVLQNQVVVFRNQSMLVGDSTKQVTMQAETYIKETLGLKIREIREAISVTKSDNQFTGALKYSNLADHVTAEHTGKDKDLELYTVAEFKSLITKEDMEVSP